MKKKSFIRSKVSKQKILRTIRSADAGKRINVTFRLPKHLLRQFKTECSKQKVSMASVIQELMKAFAGIG